MNVSTVRIHQNSLYDQQEKTRSRLGSENKESNEKEYIKNKPWHDQNYREEEKNQTPYEMKNVILYGTLFSISMTKGFEGLHIWSASKFRYVQYAS